MGVQIFITRYNQRTMRILITGSKGGVGQHLLPKLKKLAPGQWTYILEIDRNLGCDLMTCELPEADVVIHLAAQTSVENSWKDPVHDSYNFNMLVRLVQHYPKAKIIYAQSGASLKADSPYGFSKKICGDYLKKFHNNYVICVFPNIFGTGRSVVDYFKGKDEVTIFGTGQSVRDYVYVEDIAEGLIKALDWAKGEYFMGSAEGTSVLQLAEGKKVNFAAALREDKENILPNTTPDWKPKVNVFDYLNS